MRLKADTDITRLAPKTACRRHTARTVPVVSQRLLATDSSEGSVGQLPIGALRTFTESAMAESALYVLVTYGDFNASVPLGASHLPAQFNIRVLFCGEIKGAMRLQIGKSMGWCTISAIQQFSIRERS